MALRKRKPSTRITKAEIRLEAMEKMDIQQGKIINYGGEQNPVTREEMKNQIEVCKMLINDYNNALEIADKRAEELRKAEEVLGELFTRVLAGGKSIFGVDSDEVTLLGGTKKSERKKSERNQNYIQFLKEN